MTTFIRGLSNVTAADQGAVATIGNFDGVHLGHQALVNSIKLNARACNTFSMVITFEPQPLEFFRGKGAVPRLTRLREKFFHLKNLGVDKVLSIRFNEMFAQLSPQDFLEKVLFQRLKLKHIIVGEDFRFGYARKGDIALLKKMGEQRDIKVQILSNVTLNQEKVSSTAIRKALKDANHPLAEQMLGRPYTMMGRVTYGDQQGRILGFPTANIFLHREVTPLMGVYIVRLQLGEKSLPAVANVGIRPTVGGTRILLEVHIFNFNQNIYGEYVTVEFCQKIRDEERFESLEELKNHIAQDAAIAYTYFKTKGEIT